MVKATVASIDAKDDKDNSKGNDTDEREKGNSNDEGDGNFN